MSTNMGRRTRTEVCLKSYWVRGMQSTYSYVYVTHKDIAEVENTEQMI